MKLICFVSFFSVMNLNTIAQNNRVEQKTIIEDGLVKTWKIEKSYDNQGNLINYDSTYSENPMTPAKDGSLQWNSGNGKQFGFNFNGADSLRSGFNQDWQLHFDEMLRRYKEQLYHPNQVPSQDSLVPSDQFIFPENKHSQKKI